jgi:hypothetical protein
MRHIRPKIADNRAVFPDAKTLARRERPRGRIAAAAACRTAS